MTSEEILTGVGLIAVLAAGAQILASRLRIPAIVLLLPAGFAAGALTDTVDPGRLLGPAFPPLVSLAVAVILYEAGLGLDLRRLTGDTRRVVIRLIWIGALLTPVVAGLAAAPLLGMSAPAAAVLGVVLVVSGPTVVGPLLTYVRPNERLQRILVWEGSVIDAVGGILGALLFHAVTTDTGHGPVRAVLGLLASTGVGLAGGAVGAALLWLLLHRMRLDEVLAASAQLALVVGVAAGCNAVREDTGLIAAIAMGVAVATRPEFDVPALRPFFETLVSLTVGLLFVSISATVTPASLRHVVLPALVLVAVLVLAARPLVAALATVRTSLPRAERAFLGALAPRGIVAASTASTFSAGLVADGVGGAQKILPATFLVIVATVLLYGLSAVPVARRLGVTRPARSRPLLVGGEPWVVDLAVALRAAGPDVLMWAGGAAERGRIARAGLALAPGELLASAAGAGAELEGITEVYLLTAEDDFNALAGALLAGGGRGVPVYRPQPPPGGAGVVAPFMAGESLFAEGMTGAEVARRHAAGARFVLRPAAGSGTGAAGTAGTGDAVLFHVAATGRLAPVTTASAPSAPSATPGDAAAGQIVLLTPASPLS